MNLTDDKRRLLNYVKSKEIKGFPAIDYSSESYWDEYDVTTSYVSNYNFETPIELIDLLDKYINDTALSKIIAVTAYKCKPMEKEVLYKEAYENTKLPEFVYNF